MEAGLVPVLVEPFRTYNLNPDLISEKLHLRPRLF
jgi:hypothetical protein